MKKYERLTYRNRNAICIKETSTNDNKSIWNAIERLAELEDKIENGTLVELPCKAGDTVWYIKNYGFGRYVVEDMTVAGFNFSQYENTIWVVGLYEEQTSHIYKTKAEAEKKLKELNKK